MKTKQLPLGRHEQLGKKLRDMEIWLTSVAVEVSNTYGKTSDPAKRAKAGQSAVGRLRSQLDNRVYEEYGDQTPDV